MNFRNSTYFCNDSRLAFLAQRPVQILGAVLIGLASIASTAHAEIVVTGDNDPGDASFWTSGGDSGAAGTVGVTSGGSLSISGTSRLDLYDGWLGQESGVTGTATVTGVGAQWVNASGLFVGENGTGTLEVLSGGSVSSDDAYIAYNVGSTGSVLVDGDTTDFAVNYLVIGDEGNATFTIRNGASASSVGDTSIARLSGSTASVFVTGVGSTLTVGDNLTVGDYDSSGNLTISDGGQVTSGGNSSLGINASTEGSVTITGEDSSLSVDGLLLVGESGQGSLTVSGGSVTTDEAYIAYNPSSTGSVLVDGGTADFSANYLVIGDEGDAAFTISNGASASSVGNTSIARFSGSTGTVSVTGSGSTLTVGDDLYVGERGSSGNLTVSDGGQVTSGGDSSLGSYAGTEGSVTITGEGSSLSVDGLLLVGESGNGSLTVNGGSVTADEAFIAYDNGSVGSVLVDGSTADFTASYLGVGYKGDGQFTISNGASVNTTGITSMGYLPDATGTLSVKGAGSILTVGSLLVGEEGKGNLNISDGGQVTSGSNSTVALNGGGEGKVTITGEHSSWTVDGWLRLGDSGDGSLIVSDGGALSTTGDLTLSYDTYGTTPDSSLTVEGAGSQVTVGGSLNVSDYGNGEAHILDGANVQVGSEVRVGNEGGAGELTINGSGTIFAALGNLHIGFRTESAVHVSNGATLNLGRDIRVQSNGTLNVLVDRSNMINVGLNEESGNQNFINEGVVNLMADGSLAAGTYTPITAVDLFGTGTFNAVGGTWDSITREFTVSAITTDGTGDLSGKRVLYGDSLVVSFSDSTGEQAFDVTELSIGAIQGESVLGAYDFDTAINDSIVLTFFIDLGYDEGALSIWHKGDGETEWVLFNPEIYSFIDGKYSFMTSSFSSYALTAVPEPSTYAILMAAGTMLLMSFRRRRQDASRVPNGNQR